MSIKPAPHAPLPLPAPADLSEAIVEATTVEPVDHETHKRARIEIRAERKMMKKPAASSIRKKPAASLPAAATTDEDQINTKTRCIAQKAILMFKLSVPDHKPVVDNTAVRECVQRGQRFWQLRSTTGAVVQVTQKVFGKHGPAFIELLQDLHKLGASKDELEYVKTNKDQLMDMF